MLKIDKIVGELNRALPRHGRGVITPESILQTRGASCFGKLALVGAALVESGTLQDNLYMLLCLNHGIEFEPQRYWFGHAELVVELPKQILIDGMNLMDTHNLAERIDWPQGRKSGLVVVDKHRTSSIKPIEGYLESELETIQELVGPPPVHQKNHLFGVYEFAEGIQQYQALHPELSASQPIDLIQYTNCFYDLMRETSG